MTGLANKKILLMVTGSIAAFKVAGLVSSLKKLDAEVKVAVTSSALNFVGEATWEGLCGEPVYKDLWQAGRMMDHIHLNRWADLVLVAPATAQFINSAAAGYGDSLVMSLFLAHDFRKPFLIAPAMNSAMYHHPATQASLQKLKNMKIQILETGSGDLACGEVGDGRLLEVSDLLAQIEKALVTPIKKSEKALKILITSGGTSEAIDDVRVLTNRSTGKTGATLAQEYLQSGHEIYFLHSKTSERPHIPSDRSSHFHDVEFESFSDLEKTLKATLKKQIDFVFHAAAVSDFSVKPFAGKLSSEVPPQIEWLKNPKLIDSIKTWSANKKVKLVAFKLTSTSSLESRKAALQKIKKTSQADFIVHNDVQDFKDFGSSHSYAIYDNKQALLKKVKSREELAQYFLTKTLDDRRKS
jgi:phosphopantothenoylcysteine decarboxylase/phosphopantothenate--cysteine ligase